MTSSYNSEEVAKFEAMARDWWNPNGKFKPLHKMNPCRLGYITEQIAWHFGKDRHMPHAFEGLEILDVGSGGGLLCEPLTRLGGKVLGIDAAPSNIEVAKLHAAEQNLDIDYQNILAEDLLETGANFDVVLAMEIVEHVENPAGFIQSLAGLLRPGGLLVMSTLNRNSKSYLFAIIGAEYVLRWLPKGTHDWNKFITPDELGEMIENAKLKLNDQIGFVFNPVAQSWSTSHRDLSVNYAIAATKPAKPS